MKKSPVISVLLALLFPLLAQAAPPRPWVATADGPMPYSSRGECISAARSVFENKGFSRITNTRSSVMAAYRPGTEYEFKAVIKCLPAAGTAVAFVVTPLSGRGLTMANGLVSAMRYANSGSDDAGEGEGEGEGDMEMMGERDDSGGFVEEGADDADDDTYDDMGDNEDYADDEYPPAE